MGSGKTDRCFENETSTFGLIDFVRIGQKIVKEGVTSQGHICHVGRNLVHSMFKGRPLFLMLQRCRKSGDNRRKLVDCNKSGREINWILPLAVLKIAFYLEVLHHCLLKGETTNLSKVKIDSSTNL